MDHRSDTLKRHTVSTDRYAVALRLRAEGARVAEACREAGIGPSTYHRLRQLTGHQRFDGWIDELRALLADGRDRKDVTQRAKQLLLGRAPAKEVAEATEQPLTWAALERTGRQLFANKADNAHGATRRRFEEYGSEPYWQRARERAAESLNCPVDQLDDQPPAQLLRALWVASRGVEGIAP